MGHKGTKHGNRTCKVCRKKFPTEGQNVNICPACRCETKQCDCGCGTLIPKYQLGTGKKRRFVGSSHQCGEHHPNFDSSLPHFVSCDHCSKQLKRKPYKIERHAHQFCNKTCESLGQTSKAQRKVILEHCPDWQGGSVTVHCSWCNTLIEKYASLVHKHNFCNRACHGAWFSANRIGPDSTNWQGGPIVVQCDWCRLPVEKVPSVVREHNFCDQECCGKWRSDNLVGEKAANWKGGLSIAPYHPNFNNVFKEQIRQRDNCACQLCGEPGNHVHHIYYDKLNDCHNHKDFITLCHSCHSKTNGNRLYWTEVLETKIAEIYGDPAMPPASLSDLRSGRSRRRYGRPASRCLVRFSRKHSPCGSTGRPRPHRHPWPYLLAGHDCPARPASLSTGLRSTRVRPYADRKVRSSE